MRQHNITIVIQFMNSFLKNVIELHDFCFLGNFVICENKLCKYSIPVYKVFHILYLKYF